MRTRKFYCAAFLILGVTALLGNAQERTDPRGEKPWQRTIEVDPNNVAGDLAAAKLNSTQPVNWFTGRWPYISFLGGMVMGNRSEDLEFFYSEPFQWHSTVLDYVLTGGGKVYGLRAKFHRYKEGANPKPMCSFLLNIRTDVLLAEYHPATSSPTAGGCGTSRSTKWAPARSRSPSAWKSPPM